MNFSKYPIFFILFFNMKGASYAVVGCIYVGNAVIRNTHQDRYCCLWHILQKV